MTIVTAEMIKQMEQWVVGKGRHPFSHLPGYKQLPKKLQTICQQLVRNRDKDQPSLEFNNLPASQRTKLFKGAFGTFREEAEHAYKWISKPEHARLGFNNTLQQEKLDKNEIAGVAATLIIELFEIARFDPAIVDDRWKVRWLPYATVGQMDLFLASLLDRKTKGPNPILAQIKDLIADEPKLENRDDVIRALLFADSAAARKLVVNLLDDADKKLVLRIVSLAKCSNLKTFAEIVDWLRKHKHYKQAAYRRILNTWFNMRWKASDVREIEEALKIFAEGLRSKAKLKSHLSGKKPTAAYFALCATALTDLTGAIREAGKLLKHKNTDCRFVATWFLGHLTTEQSIKARLIASEDEDLRVATWAITGVEQKYVSHSIGWQASEFKGDQVFNAIATLAQRMPDKPLKLKPCVWSWTGRVVSRLEISENLHLATQNGMKLLPFFDILSDHAKSFAVKDLIDKEKKKRKIGRDGRLAIISQIASTDEFAFEKVVSHLKKFKPAGPEIEFLERTVSGKNDKVQSAWMTIVRKLKKQDALDCLTRLLNSRSKPQRELGEKLLENLSKHKLTSKAAKEIGKEYKQKIKAATKSKPVSAKTKKAKPSAVKFPKSDPVFGRLKFQNDEYVTGLFAKAKWKGKPFAVQFNGEDKETCYSAMRAAKKFWKSQNKWTKALDAYIRDQLDQGEFQVFVGEDNPKLEALFLKEIRYSWFEFYIDDKGLGFSVNNSFDMKDNDWEHWIINVYGHEVSGPTDIESYCLL